MKKSYDFNIPVLLSPLKNNANKLDGETLQKFRVNRMASDTGKHHTQDPMHLLKKRYRSSPLSALPKLQDHWGSSLQDLSDARKLSFLEKEHNS